MCIFIARGATFLYLLEERIGVRGVTYIVSQITFISLIMVVFGTEENVFMENKLISSSFS